MSPSYKLKEETAWKLLPSGQRRPDEVWGKIPGILSTDQGAVSSSSSSFGATDNQAIKHTRSHWLKGTPCLMFEVSREGKYCLAINRHMYWSQFVC